MTMKTLQILEMFESFFPNYCHHMILSNSQCGVRLKGFDYSRGPWRYHMAQEGIIEQEQLKPDAPPPRRFLPDSQSMKQAGSRGGADGAGQQSQLCSSLEGVTLLLPTHKLIKCI